MKAIQTKYHGHTNHKPARISARAESCKQRFYSIPMELSVDESHAWAALEYARERGWLPKPDEKLIHNGRKRFSVWLTGGGMPDGSVAWTFSNSWRYTHHMQELTQ